ncbi:mevalonate kinase [Candidatus Roizmanbacteria bacterium CG06_land_8_20_14_3_00_34_14]|uniref:mevalonate kinase n=2 Tax=Candidatus Roizmaniibacteriota TaxID=1752723 RepID=A0A2M7ATW6_9BACT|nr:MAG: mevalonate kinase [Candidatus Roizmanbacteria bacterium CG07_land_8_20_14_0_80_34_15]PIU74070.1 MAG: mevalonate kinase [Candidatus Roizmanbacteria bacterium CG06_land_8_20_14_3_00_34_14]
MKVKIIYSAPAKAILSGEHAVVYGKPALATAINLRLKFIVTKLARSYKDSKSMKEINFISDEVKKYLIIQKIKYVDKPFNYKIESEIPVGRGLGSSAALSVASVASFLEFYTGKQFDKKIINDIAFEIEKHFHSNPSGVDNYASCFGGLILYQKKVSLKKLNDKISKNIEKNLLLIDSGKPEETTGEIVESVESVKSVETLLNNIENETNNILSAIEKENVDQFKNSLFVNEKLLEELGIVSDRTKKLLKELSKFGVGKVTGAGGRKKGSGFILFYTDQIDKLINYLIKRKIIYHKFIPDNIGLKRISTLIN